MGSRKGQLYSANITCVRPAECLKRSIDTTTGVGLLKLQIGEDKKCRFADYDDGILRMVDWMLMGCDGYFCAGIIELMIIDE